MNIKECIMIIYMNNVAMAQDVFISLKKAFLWKVIKLVKLFKDNTA